MTTWVLLLICRNDRGVLTGMHMGDGAEVGRTAVNVGEVNKGIRRGAAASRRRAGNPAFVQVHGSGIEVCRLSIGNGGKFEVIDALGGAAAAQQVAAVGDARVVKLGPGGAAVFGLPDKLVGAVSVDIPEIHFVAPGDDRKLSAINRAARRGRACGTSDCAQSGRLIVQAAPIGAVGGGINAMPLDRGKKLSGNRVIYNGSS